MAHFYIDHETTIEHIIPDLLSAFSISHYITILFLYQIGLF